MKKAFVIKTTLLFRYLKFELEILKFRDKSCEVLILIKNQVNF